MVHPITSVHKQMGMFFQNSFYDILIEVLYPNRAMSRLAQTVEYVSDFFSDKAVAECIKSSGSVDPAINGGKFPIASFTVT